MNDETERPAEDPRKAALAKARAAKAAKKAAASAATPPQAPSIADPEIDPDNIQLSAADLARIEAKAKAQIAAERKKALESQALTAALEKIRGKAGLITGNPEEDRLVTLTIDVGASADGILINGMKRFHGQTVEVPLHVARSLMEICYRTQIHEEEISGKGRMLFKPRRVTLNRRNAGAVTARIAQGMGDAA